MSDTARGPEVNAPDATLAELAELRENNATLARRLQTSFDECESLRSQLAIEEDVADIARRAMGDLRREIKRVTAQRNAAWRAVVSGRGTATSLGLSRLDAARGFVPVRGARELLGDLDQTVTDAERFNPEKDA